MICNQSEHIKPQIDTFQGTCGFPLLLVFRKTGRPSGLITTCCKLCVRALRIGIHGYQWTGVFMDIHTSPTMPMGLQGFGQTPPLLNDHEAQDQRGWGDPVLFDSYFRKKGISNTNNCKATTLPFIEVMR